MNISHDKLMKVKASFASPVNQPPSQQTNSPLPLCRCGIPEMSINRPSACDEAIPRIPPSTHVHASLISTPPGGCGQEVGRGVVKLRQSSPFTDQRLFRTWSFARMSGLAKKRGFGDHDYRTEHQWQIQGGG
ncbi:hypothetical protein AVEN_247421-1 [Araneus ventricosus]|uniref:Uncharacterized protein n=1 Tax=Araneus ventricosus TaxID=182803 RepID=A0A4Y2H7J4_ARAVE|nr:hypothetical protein AVEN_247421-1 [Araneus ventricosus]